MTNFKLLTAARARTWVLPSWNTLWRVAVLLLLATNLWMQFSLREDLTDLYTTVGAILFEQQNYRH